MLLTLVCICQDHPRLKKFQAKAFPLYHECEKVYEGKLFIQLLVQIAFFELLACVSQTVQLCNCPADSFTDMQIERIIY